MTDIIVNSRILKRPTTGVQRYTREIIRRWPEGSFRTVEPEGDPVGMRAHAWEQMVLPRRVRGLLWSPSNSGPLAVERQVLTIHDLVFFDMPETLSRRNAQWYQILLRRLVGRVRRIIAVSDFTKSRILAHFPIDPERIAVIHNGVDPSFQPQPEAEIARVRQRLNVPEGRYVLSLCSLQPRKNLRRVLSAWRALEDSIDPDVTLVVTGMQGELRHYGETDLGTLPKRIHFTGHVDDADLPGLVGGALALVYVPLYEGFGLPPLEAMASGVPVVVSENTSLDEVVGDAGLAVDPHSDEAVAEALRMLIENESERARLAQAGLARARAFTWDRASAQTLDVLKQAA